MIATAPAPRRSASAQHAPARSWRSLPATAGWLGAGLITGLLVGWRRAEQPLADSDVFWGARAGLDLLRTGTLPRHDPYSWTVHGATWVPNSWGWNVVLGLAYRLGGLAGIAVLGAVGCGALGLLIGAASRAAGCAGWSGPLVFQLVGGLFAVFLYARPQLVDYLAVLALPLLLARALSRERPSARPVLVLVAVEIVWMNLHSTAILGPPLLLAAGVGSVLMRPSGQRRTTAWTVAGIVTATSLATLATPYGWAPIAHAEDVRNASVGLITEWAPAGFATPEQLLAVAAMGIGAVALATAWRLRRFDTVLVLLVLEVGSLLAVRVAPLLALSAVPMLAWLCGRIRVGPHFFRQAWVVTTAVALVLCLAGVGGFARAGAKYDSARLVALLPAHCRLLNDYDIGGQVILDRPDVPVSIDSRNDVYGRARGLDSLRVLDNLQAGEQFVRRTGVTCVLAPTASALVQGLEHTPGWGPLGSDPVRTLLVRAP